MDRACTCLWKPQQAVALVSILKVHVAAAEGPTTWRTHDEAEVHGTVVQCQSESRKVARYWKVLRNKKGQRGKTGRWKPESKHENRWEDVRCRK